MSNHIQWITLLRRTYPPPEHYDEYRVAQTYFFCEEQRWATAELTALAIHNEQLRIKTQAYIDLVRYGKQNNPVVSQEPILENGIVE